jgi:hypothetical protein
MSQSTCFIMQICAVTITYEGESKQYTNPITREPNSLKFQMLLIYTTEGSSVHGHVIRAHAQKEHSCGSLTWRPNWKTDLAWKSKELYIFLWAPKVSAADIHRQLVELYGKDVMSR